MSPPPLPVPAGSRVQVQGSGGTRDSRCPLVQDVMSPPPPPAPAGSRVQVLVSLAPGATAAGVTAMQQELQDSVASGQLADSLRIAGAPCVGSSLLLRGSKPVMAVV